MLLALQLTLSMAFILYDAKTSATWVPWLVPSTTNVWRLGHVWTLATGPVFQPDFIWLIFDAAMLWMFMPQLENFWGTARFLRYAAMTAIFSTLIASLMGFVIGSPGTVLGMNSLVMGALVAFGVIYKHQKVSVFGVLMTARQLMLGYLVFEAAFIVFERAWDQGAANAAAVGFTLLIMSPRYSPELMWQRFSRRFARSSKRTKLAVLDGGKGKGPFVPPGGRSGTGGGSGGYLN